MSRLVEILTQARHGMAQDAWDALKDGELRNYARLFSNDQGTALHPIDPIVFEGQTYTVGDAFIIKPESDGQVRLVRIDRGWP